MISRRKATDFGADKYGFLALIIPLCFLVLFLILANNDDMAAHARPLRQVHSVLITSSNYRTALSLSIYPSI